MKIFVIYLVASIAASSAGIIENTGTGVQHFGESKAVGYNLEYLNGIANTEQRKFANFPTGPLIPKLKSVQIISNGAHTNPGVVGYKLNNRVVQHIIPEYRSFHIIPHKEINKLRTVQLIKPVVQPVQEIRTFGVIKENPQQVRDVKTLQIVQKQSVAVPQLKFLNTKPGTNFLKVNKQSSTPVLSLDVRNLQIIGHHPAPLPQVKNIQVIPQISTPSPNVVKTLRLIDESEPSHIKTIRIIHEENNAKFVENKDLDVQTIRIVHEGNGDEKSRTIKVIKT